MQKIKHKIRILQNFLILPYTGILRRRRHRKKLKSCDGRLSSERTNKYKFRRGYHVPKREKNINFFISIVKNQKSVGKKQNFFISKDKNKNNSAKTNSTHQKSLLEYSSDRNRDLNPKFSNHRHRLLSYRR